MAPIEEVRAAVVAWASAHGILVDSFPKDATSSGNPAFSPFTSEDSEYFRQPRKISRVTASVKTLTISTRVKVAETKIKKLQQKFSERFSEEKYNLVVDVSKHFKVDQRLDTFGRLNPIKWIPTDGEGRRIACGSSVGLGNQRNAGTLTALARLDGDKTQLFGISCNHVLGGCSTARLGTPIVVPGIQDVTPEHNEIYVIGSHGGTARMSQGLPEVIDVRENHDLAFFVIDQQELVTSMQGEGAKAFDTPMEFATACPGMEVKKWGRSTGLTTGSIVSISTDPEPIEYNVTSYFGPMRSEVFRGTVYYGRVFEVSGFGSAPFSVGGDSGALVVDTKAEKVVGIVVAGGGDKSLVLPIDVALKSLGLSLIGGHNL